MKNFFGGSVRFCVQSNDINLLNRIRKFGIRDVEVEYEISFSTALKNAEIIKKYLPKGGYTAVENKNSFRVMNFFYTRKLVSVLTIVCLLGFIISTGFIFRVEVSGVEGRQREEVERFLRQSGFRQVMPKTVGFGEVSNQITTNFDFVAHTSSRIVGSTLHFRVYTVPTPKNTETGDIVSRHDAIVTSVVVASGTPLVNVGSIVHAGDILIQGTRAMGVVMGTVSFSDFGTDREEVLQRIITGSGIENFDKIEVFEIPSGLEVVASITKSIV